MGDGRNWLDRFAIWAQGGERRLRAMDRLIQGGSGRGRAASRRAIRGATIQQALGRLARAFGLHGWRSGVAVAATGVALVLIASAALGGRSGGGRSTRLTPGTASRYPEIIGFYQNGWSQIYKSSFGSVQQHYQTLDTVLAFWYSIDGNGNLHSNAPKPSVTQWIKAHRMRMGVLINNIPGPAGDNGAMLTDPAARQRAVTAIANLVHRDGYQEVNIDFELLKPSTRSGLVSFMRALRAALPKNVILSESVFPKVGVTSDINGAYNYIELAKYVDYLVIMLYDKHSDGGPAGPVSPYSWVVDNMNWFLHTAKIPPQKIVIAAGVYGYDWPTGSTHAQEMPLTQITNKLQQTGATPRIDATSKEPYFTYTDNNGTPHIVWYQNKDTVLQRLKLAEQLGIRGLAIWALGEETPAVWGVIEQTWTKGK